jgi:hypothetical protein
MYFLGLYYADEIHLTLNFCHNMFSTIKDCQIIVTNFPLIYRDLIGYIF